jgi:hypothetical protein
VPGTGNPGVGNRQPQVPVPDTRVKKTKPIVLSYTLYLFLAFAVEKKKGGK